MKKTILTLLVMLSANSIWSQAPNKMSFQAVVRDADNNLVSNQSVGLKVSILSGDPDGTSEYDETHSVSSNVNGLVSIIIGEGNNPSGSFSAINWTSSTHYIKTEIDPNGGSNYTITGVQQLLSVPYAMHANTADNLGGVEGNNIGDMLYWDGNNWVTIPAGESGQFMSFCNGKPTWGLCIETEIGQSSATTIQTINSRINSDFGNIDINERGVCYDTDSNPTIQNFTKVSNSNNSAWSTFLTGLVPNTTYYARAYIINNSGVEYGNEVSFTTGNTLDIGDYYPEEGGVIFYLLQPGDSGYDPNIQHGLIVSLEYLSPTQYSNWGCEGTLIGTSDEIGSGSSNTNAIISGCNNATIIAQLCNDFSSEGFNDWYLGALEEVQKLQQQRIIVNASIAQENGDTLSSSLHWTSSEDNDENAFLISFSGNFVTTKPKEGNFVYHVRPFRSF